MKIVYYDETVIIAEDQSEERAIFYPYCGGCNRGFWYPEMRKLTRCVFDSLSIKLKDKLKMSNLEPK